ncbi:SEC-C metal-binding domain-containing protein [Desulfoferrobacter suflitae]|uniref:SEC-C metal-binding domain-containing protein n=1 Tax=Desulfoferrobacter suflitae TaxID=2865782 RepID=UPI0021643445|nr:SEC-C metal-binding domain-containing protein [Desulfoferrobacter suflitae]MCK8600564.1 SEC-C metal-binding domain-containing protein [Desulfoferrobacter suflitae]
MQRTQSPVEPSRNPLQPVFDLMQGGDAGAICERYQISRDELEKRLHAYQESRRQMALADQIGTEKVGRNEPCPCGSGRKFKKCCLPKQEEMRKAIPADQLQELEEKQRLRERLEKDVQNGFDLLFAQDFSKARQFAQRLLDTHPEDDRLHDIMVIASIAVEDYDGAFHICRSRWQIAQEEKEFYQENGYHKREGTDRTQLVYFYSPSTWLEKFWISQRARTYQKDYPPKDDERLRNLVGNLKIANDVKRFPARQDEGYEARKQALEPVLTQIARAGEAAIPYLLPLTYNFSWAGLFVPDLLAACGTDTSIRLLGELSMFRFPFFAHKCLSNLEKFNDRAVMQIKEILQNDPAFDELKVGLISVLGNIRTGESFQLLCVVTEHPNPYVVNWAAEALGRHKNPDALPYLNRARERLGALSKIAGAIKDLVAGN